jgi:hypothetical protein
MLRGNIPIEHLAAIISATSAVEDNREAQLRLRTAAVAYDYDGCVIDALLDLLATGDAVLRAARHGCLMILWIANGADREAWFSVEPAGLCCLYHNGPDTWR